MFPPYFEELVVLDFKNSLHQERHDHSPNFCPTLKTTGIGFFN
jgi:hypothetical protein